MDRDTVTFDSLSVDQFSLRTVSQVNPSYYSINFIEAKVIRLKKDTAFTLEIIYRVFPINFGAKIFHKDFTKLDRDFSRPENPVNIIFGKDPLSKKNLLDQDGLSKNGSISRGILFGNNQDVVVNSSLNLQVSGKLTNDIQLSLAATDNNIPVQPDGNTQQLQEFDKVYIQLHDEHTKLIAGDFQIDRPKSYFMNFYKRMQGLLLTNKTDIRMNEKKSGILSTTVSGAVSRGRFARNIIQGSENNQGPYRLVGAEKESFIIVLSGTEKVFIDGKQLVRGQENDYIIDYNNAEVSFTAKNIITKDKRIIVEFQYAERNYSRSLYYASSEWTTKKTRVFLHFYQERDNKNRPLMQELTDSGKVKLSLVGDTLSSAVSPGFQQAEFNSLEVFYRKTDTLINSVLYPAIFIYNTSPDSISYRVKFSFVGMGNGNYVQIPSSANGRVYQWVAPIGGIKQGDHEPLIQLVTPKKKQMLITGIENQVGKQGKVSIESVLTVNDINTFSSIDSKDDNGQGIKFNFSNKHEYSKPDSLREKLFSVAYAAGYEFVQKNFSPIERFRAVEFERDWNRNLNGNIINDQHIFNGGLTLAAGKAWSGSYLLNSFIEGKQFSGLKHSFVHTLQYGLFKIGYNSSLVNTTENNRKTAFYRHKSNAAIKVKSVQLSYSDEFEHNIFRTGMNVLGNSYQFWEWESSVSSIDTSNNSFKVFYKERRDLKAYTSTLSDSAYAQNAGIQIQLNSNRNHIIRMSSTLRKIDFLGSTFSGNKPDNNFLGRIEYFPKLFKGLIQSSVFYESGYGMELRREYSYLEVAAGQGQYFWNDYNGNGIKELNEFELAQFPDQAIYIRVWTPTNNYIKVNRDQFSYSMTVRPSVFKKYSSGKVSKILSRFVSQTVFRSDRKTQSELSWERFNPIVFNNQDSLLTGMNYSFRQALFFNQSSPVFGLDFTYTDNRNRQLLTNGYETRLSEISELKMRWNITKSWAIFQNTLSGMKSSISELFTSRNYRISYIESESRVTYQPSTAFRLSLSYKHIRKTNPSTLLKQMAVFNDVGLELKFNQLGKGSIISKFNFIGITYNDNQNTPVAFEMLNALKQGNNFTWNINYQQNLTGNLQVSITYDGRKSPGNKIIHIGGAQVRAFF